LRALSKELEPFDGGAKAIMDDVYVFGPIWVQPSASTADAQRSQRSRAQRTAGRSASSEDLPWQPTAAALSDEWSNARASNLCAPRPRRAGRVGAHHVANATSRPDRQRAAHPKVMRAHVVCHWHRVTAVDGNSSGGRSAATGV
jgi:hypothetical protein